MTVKICKICPITQEPIKDPVLAPDYHIYEQRIQNATKDSVFTVVKKKPNRSSMTFGTNMRNDCSNVSWKSATLILREKKCFVSCS